MNAMEDDVKAEIIQHSYPHSSGYLTAEGSQIELAQSAFGECMLAIPDYLSCISHSEQLLLRRHASLLRAEVRSSSAPLFLKTEVRLILFPVTEDHLQLDDPTDLYVLN